MKYIFKYMDLKISISSENYNIINYCIDYFKNYFYCSYDDFNDVIVSIDIMDCFSGESDYVLEAEEPFKIYVHKSGKRIIIVNIEEKKYREFMRLIRELFVYYITLTKRCCFFHAACVANNELAVAIIGDKFAGKTTMCLNFLNFGWNFISNDKLVLVNKDNNILCWGLPIALGIREGTKQLFAEKLNDLPIDQEDNRYYLTPNQLIDRFNIKVANGKKLKMILIPIFCPEAQNIIITKMPEEEAIPFLKKQKLESIYSNRKKMNRLAAYSNDDFINSLIEIPIYKVVINKEINSQLKDAIEDILKKEEK